MCEFECVGVRERVCVCVCVRWEDPGIEGTEAPTIEAAAYTLTSSCECMHVNSCVIHPDLWSHAHTLPLEVLACLVRQ